MPLLPVLSACLVRLVLSAVLLFGSAGTIDWVQGWLLLFTVSGVSALGQILLAVMNSSLVHERLTPGAGQPFVDRLLCCAIVVLFNFWLAAMALETQRFDIVFMAGWLKWPGICFILAGQWLSFAAQCTNRFASAVVRIQHERRQQVISSGPYCCIRHPMYTANLMMFVGGALLAGSLAGLVIAGLLAALFMIRIRIEERALLAGLPQYSAYSHRVCYRLIPFLW